MDKTSFHSKKKNKNGIANSYLSIQTFVFSEMPSDFCQTFWIVRSRNSKSCFRSL